jgi:hypothetical protein
MRQQRLQEQTDHDREVQPALSDPIRVIPMTQALSRRDATRREEFTTTLERIAAQEAVTRLD